MAKTTTQPYAHKTTLYRVVFDGVSVKVGVAVLFSFLLTQPIAPAFAAEIGAPIDNTASVESSTESDQTQEIEEKDEVIEVTEISDTQSETVEEQSTLEETESPQEILPLETTDDSNTTISVNEEVPSGDINTPEVITDTTASTTDAIDLEEQSSTSTVIGVDNSNDAVASTTNQFDEEPQSESSAEETTSTDVATSTTSTTDSTAHETNTPQTVENQTPIETEHGSTTKPQELVVEHSAHAYEFDTSQCTSVGDGAFYCSTADDDTQFVQDGVFAQQDEDGDLEIFVRLGGQESKITSNQVDDGAPYYDPVSERIVWHSMLHDRYQIISYDLKRNTTSQLTDVSYNNMEPVAYGDVTLWQAWMDDNWEILMYENGTVTQLTNNTVHDVSPHMRDGHIVWQTQFEDGWRVAIYDSHTKNIQYIESEGGTKVENPRYVLVYDSTNAAGDVQTLGYDFDNKQSFTLNSIPISLPEELPDPDQTGETRALLQNKNPLRDIEIEQAPPTPPTGTGATSTDAMLDDTKPTLDLTASSTTQAASSTQNALQDLVVLPYDTKAASSSVESPIVDLVIPPSVSTSTAEIS